MTTERRLPGFPATLDSARFQIGKTVAASDGLSLAAAANEVAVGQPAARAAVPRTAGGTYELVYTKTPGVRFLRVHAVFVPTVIGGTAWVNTYGTVALSVTDGTTTVAAGAAPFPLGWNGERHYVVAPAAVNGRYGNATVIEGFLDLSAAATYGLASLLNPAVPWRFTAVVTTASTVVCEQLALEEVPSFLVDDASAVAGALLAPYVARGVIDDADQFQRMQLGVEAAYGNPRTLLATSWDEGTTAALPQGSATTTAALANLVEFGTTTPTTWRVKPPRLPAAATLGCPIVVRLRVVFLAGAAGNTATFQVTTGAGSVSSAAVPYSAAYQDVVITGAFLRTDVATDTIQLRYRVSVGTATVAVSVLHVDTAYAY
jgi:hypothetical protein